MTIFVSRRTLPLTEIHRFAAFLDCKLHPSEIAIGRECGFWSVWVFAYSVEGKLHPPGATPILYTLAAGFSADDRMIPFRYDGRVFKLSDFTNDPEAIVKSFDDLGEIAKTRPEAPRDLLGEKDSGLRRVGRVRDIW